MGERPLPTFDELPNFHNFPGCAWDVWGRDDQLGTVNLLTEPIVAEAAKEIKLGKCVCLNWPLNFPSNPVFNRQPPKHELWTKAEESHTINDDMIHINTQSGTQWDGLRHYGVLEHKVFYNNTHADSFPRGSFTMSDPNDIDPELIKLGIHNWAQHGICGRGVLLDLINYYTADGSPLPYDPWSTHGISVQELEAVAEKQGVTFKRGDILILRVGFIQKYYKVSQEQRDDLVHQKNWQFAGIEPTDDMKRFLWNNHFAAIASDQPALEVIRWPDPDGSPKIHQTLLGLWGMPIGEFFDLEALSKVCAETGRYTFFFSSWPLNVLGGVASPPNAAAYL